MNIAEKYQLVSEKVTAIAISSGREPEDVSVIAVSKTHPASTVLEAIDGGALLLGENKVQEGLGKIAEIARDDVEWHLIGHLQKNKVRKAVRSFDVIQTIDSIKLAKRIDRIAGEESRALKAYIQVDLAGEASKSGVGEGGVFEIADYLNDAPNLEFIGLMSIPPFFDDPEKVRPYFRELRELRDELRDSGQFSATSGELSMGMSNDYHVAIEEGATLVRVGAAIFGERGQPTV